MKKFTLPFLAIALATSFSARAQITITKADMPAAGYKFTQATDASGSITSTGASGAGVTWSFGSLVSTAGDADTLTGYIPSATPYASNFPAATNLCLKVYSPGTGANDSWEYLNSGSGSQTLYGLAFYNASTSAYIFYKYNPTWAFVTLPATYKSKWSGTYRSVMHEVDPALNGLGYDSLGEIEHGVYHDSIDGWGNLTTPLGTYGAIRNKHTETDYDTTIVHVIATNKWIPFSTPTKSYNNNYAWYANGVHYSLLSISVDSTGTKVTQVQWLQTAVTGINELSNNNGKAQIYPNPATDVLTIKINTTDAAYTVITDISGKQLEKVKSVSGVSEVNTSGYASGIYLYQILDENGNALDCGKFSVVR